MIGTLIKTLAYTKAPRTTFTVMHPRRAVKLGKMKYDMRHAYAPRVAALGAFLIGLPLGFLMARVFARDGGDTVAESYDPGVE